MTFSRFALHAAICWLALGILAAQEKPELAAQKTAEPWLALIDAAKYEQSYDEAAAEMKAKITKPQWVQNFGAMRATSGTLKSRKLLGAIYTEDVPNAPAGRYVVMQFQATFAAGSYSEQVVSIMEKDGSWRAVGYVMSPNQ